MGQENHVNSARNIEIQVLRISGSAIGSACSGTRVMSMYDSHQAVDMTVGMHDATTSGGVIRSKVRRQVRCLPFNSYK